MNHLDIKHLRLMQLTGFFWHFPSRISKEKDVELTTSFSVIDILSGEPIPDELLPSIARFRFGSTWQNSKQLTIFTNLSNFPATFTLFLASMRIISSRIGILL